MKNIFRYVIGLVLVSIFSNSSVHAWEILNGVGVCTVPNPTSYFTYPLVTPDGQGGVIVAWSDQRSGGAGTNYDVYAQRLDTHGNALWTPNGVAICTADNLQYVVAMTSDGQGGAVILWQDSRNGTHVYAQRVNSQGSTLWTNQGLAVCTAATDQFPTDMISDGTTITIVWLDGRNTNGYGADIYAQKMDYNGNFLWMVNGVPVCVEATNAYQEYQPRLADDGQGGVIFSWYGTATGNSATWGIYAQLLNSQGSALWSPSYGVPMKVTYNDGSYPQQMVPDGAGGAYIDFIDGRLGAGLNTVIIQHVNSEGSTLLVFNGVAISTVNQGNSSNPTMISDGNGGAMISWQEPRNYANNIFVQRINSQASSLWNYGGVNMCAADWGATNPVISSDSNGGAIVVWQDYRNFNTSGIYTQRVNGNGSTLWTYNGVEICTTNYDDIYPSVCADGLGGAFFAWQDHRDDANYYVYAQSIYSTGSITLPYPVFSQLPSLKLFNSQSLATAFDLSDYITVTPATTYSIISNFQSLSTLTGSLVGENSYGSSTVGTNIYEAANENGYSNATNEVKYSYYKIYKLPHVGLTAGSSWDINVAKYTYNEFGSVLAAALPAIPDIFPNYPPSFGNASALIVSDTTLVSAVWLDSTSIRITSSPTYTSGGPVSVDVIASIYSNPPYDDMDKERIWVYPNLLSNSTFSTANDTAVWSPMEIPPGRSTIATQQWMQSYTDSAGTQAQGVWKFTFADANGGVKSTPNTAHWISITNGEWYIYRIHLVADTPNNTHLACLYCYTNLPGSGTQTDIVGNVLFGVPTVWTWQEAPLLAHGSSTTGYPQFQFKANGAGSIYVDEIQIINATPELMQARSNTHSHYLYGQFTTGNDTTGWGQELYFGAVSAPSITVNNGLVLNFAGAAPGSSGQEGIKWTANNGVQGPLHAYSFPDNVGHQVGTQLTLSIVSGNFNTLGIVLVAAYGTATAGDQDIDNLIAAAGVGVLVSGNYYAIGEAQYPYAQGQFGLRSDAGGILEVTNVDVNVDNDDPNFGDPTLFQ